MILSDVFVVVYLIIFFPKALPRVFFRFFFFLVPVNQPCLITSCHLYFPHAPPHQFTPVNTIKVILIPQEIVFLFLPQDNQW